MNTRPWWLFSTCFAASLAMIALALHLWGAAEIRATAQEVILLTFLGLMWLFIASLLFPWFGVSLWDDAIERRNDGALTAVCGGLLALAAIYIGGSAGEGPSYFNNFFSAGLGTVGLFGLWAVLEVGGKISRSVTEERDLGAGLRLGGFLLGTGLILGRAVAGNWHSGMATLRDFAHDGWPAALLCALAISVEWGARPRRLRPFPPWPVYGLMPVLIYLAIAVSWVLHLGPWEGMPK